MLESSTAPGLIRSLLPSLFATGLREKAAQQLRDSGASQPCIQLEGDRRCFRSPLEGHLTLAGTIQAYLTHGLFLPRECLQCELGH